MSDEIRWIRSYVPKSGAEQGIAIGVDPARRPKVDGTEFQGLSSAAAYAGLERGGAQGEVVGIIDAIGAMGGMEMRLSLDTMRRVYSDYPPTELAVEARDADARPARQAKLATLLDRKYPNLEMQSAADAKEEVSDEINRTFNMFNAIVIIAIVVSLLGVINTLAMSVIERTREIGVLRALGASRWQVRSTMLDESLMITIAGSLVGVAAVTLISVGWLRGLDEVLPGMSFHFPGPVALTVAIAAVLLGVIAAILPARRAARLKVIEALTYE